MAKTREGMLALSGLFMQIDCRLVGARFGDPDAPDSARFTLICSQFLMARRSRLPS
jgi:hypothetical protein